MADRSVVVRLLANVAQFEREMDRARQGTDKVGKAMIGVGLAAGAGVAAAVVKFAQFDRQMSAVQAATMATGKEMDALSKTALKAGADTAFSANEAAQGIEELAKAGIKTKDIVGGGLTGALDLAAAGGLDVASAAEIAATAIVQFGLEGKDVVGVADALAAGAGKAQGSVQDLGLALSYAGVPAAALGLSVEETTGTLALFANAGITGEKAGTALRAMLVSLQNPSEKASGLMAELGINVFDSQGKFIGMEATAGVLQDRLAGLTDQQRGAALATIFGNESLGAATTLYNGGAGAVSKWTAAVSESGYAAETAAARLDNLYGDVEALQGSFETLLIGLGEGADGPLRDLTQDATSMVNAFSGAPSAFKQTVIGLGVVTTGVGLLGGAAFLAVPRIIAANVALAAMGPSGAAAAAGLSAAARGLVAFSGPLAILTGGALIAVDYWLDNKQAIDQYRSSLDQATGAITDLTRRQADKILTDAGARDAAAKLGLSMDLVTEASLGNKDAIAQVDAVLAEHNTKVGEGTGLYGAWMRFADATTITMNEQGEAADVLARQLGIQNDRVTEARTGVEGYGRASEETRAQLFGLGEQVETVGVLAPVTTEAVGAMGGAIEETAAQSEEAQAALQEWRDELWSIMSSYVEPLSVYTGLLDEKTQAEEAAAQATADSTEDAEDSWEDYVGAVDVSLDEYAARLEEQNAAQEEWRANLVTITQRGGLEVTQILAGMGAEGAQITADMATATDAEFQRMANALIAEAQFGGKGATAALDTELRVMARVAAAGAGDTAASIARELGIGVGEVERIAAQYSSALAGGINPLLDSLGRPKVDLGRGRTGPVRYAMADGGLLEDHTAQIAPAGAWRVWAEPETGGEAYIPLAESKRSRSVDIWMKTGKLLGVDQGVEKYAAGGFSSAAAVPRPSSTAPYRMPVSTAGDATMQKGYDEVVARVTKELAAQAAREAASVSGVGVAGPPPGGGASLVAIGNWIRSKGGRVSGHPAFGGVTRGAHSPTSLHYKNRAIDVNYGGGGANAQENAFVRGILPDLRRMAAFRQVYYREIGGRTDHDDHLHLGLAKGGILNPHVRDQGGPLLPGFTLNATGGPETVVPSGRMFDSTRDSSGSPAGRWTDISIPVTVYADEASTARRYADAAVTRMQDAIAAYGLAGIANGGS